MKKKLQLTVFLYMNIFFRHISYIAYIVLFGTKQQYRNVRNVLSVHRENGHWVSHTGKQMIREMLLFSFRNQKVIPKKRKVKKLKEMKRRCGEWDIDGLDKKAGWRKPPDQTNYLLTGMIWTFHTYQISQAFFNSVWG